MSKVVNVGVRRWSRRWSRVSPDIYGVFFLAHFSIPLYSCTTQSPSGYSTTSTLSNTSVMAWTWTSSWRSSYESSASRTLHLNEGVMLGDISQTVIPCLLYIIYLYFICLHTYLLLFGSYLILSSCQQTLSLSHYYWNPPALLAYCYYLSLLRLLYSL